MVCPQPPQRGLLLRGARNLLVEDCVANDLVLPRPGTAVLTGCNLSGKSTLLKTVATIIVLHQIGSFVPATFARLPIFDLVGYRRGTSDAATIGMSSFTQQMADTASLLRCAATSTAFLFFDELGAATAVDEGEAIATAVLEYAAAQEHYCIATTHFARLARNQAFTPLQIRGFRVFDGVAASDGILAARSVGFCPAVLALT